LLRRSFSLFNIMKKTERDSGLIGEGVAKRESGLRKRQIPVGSEVSAKRVRGEWNNGDSYFTNFRPHDFGG